MLKKIDNPIDFLSKNSVNKQFYIASFIDINDMLPKYFLQEYGFYYNYDLKRHARKLSDQELNELVFPFDVISDDKIFVKKANNYGKSRLDPNVKYFNKTPQMLCEEIEDIVTSTKNISFEKFNDYIKSNPKAIQKIIKAYKNGNLDKCFLNDEIIF